MKQQESCFLNYIDYEQCSYCPKRSWGSGCFYPEFSRLRCLKVGVRLWSYGEMGGSDVEIEVKPLVPQLFEHWPLVDQKYKKISVQKCKKKDHHDRVNRYSPYFSPGTTVNLASDLTEPSGLVKQHEYSPLSPIVVWNNWNYDDDILDRHSVFNQVDLNKISLRKQKL